MARPKKEPTPNLKGYQRRFKNKLVIGFGGDRMLLQDGSWWKLVKPYHKGPHAKLEVCGSTITNVELMKNKLELTLERETSPRPVKLYLHWIDSKGHLVQPQLVNPARPKATFPEDEDPEWAEIDRGLTMIEGLVESYEDKENS